MIPDSNDHSVALSVEGPGLVYKTQIPVTLAQRVVLMVTRVQMGEHHDDHEGLAAVTKTSAYSGAPNEFIQQAKPARFLDKITALAVFLKRARGQDSFSGDDIKRMFPTAGLSVPSTFYRELGKAVKAGFIARHDDGSFYVTGTGENATDQAFSPEYSKPIKSTRRRRRGKSVEPDSSGGGTDEDARLNGDET